MDRTDERRRRPPQGRDPGRERQRPVRAEERWDDPPRRRDEYPSRERRPAPPGDPRRSGYDRMNTRDPRQGTRPRNYEEPRRSREYNAPPRRNEYEQPRRRSEYEQPRRRSEYEQPRRSREYGDERSREYAQPRPREYDDPRRREQSRSRESRPNGQGQVRRSGTPQSRQPGNYGAPPRKYPPQQDPRRRTYDAPARRTPEAPPQRPRTEAERRRRREQERRRRQMQRWRNMAIMTLVTVAAVIAVFCLYGPAAERPDRPQIFHPEKVQESATEPPTEATEPTKPVKPPIEVTPISSLEDLATLEVPAYVDVQIIDVDGVSRRGVQLEEINGIVLHYVGNPGTTALQNRNWYAESNSDVSSHFVVGLNGEVIQCVPLDEKSSASNHRNRDTISIEICHPDDTGKFSDTTYDSVIELVAWLVKACDLEVEDVIRHYEVTGKVCPKYYVENDDAWQQLRTDVAERLGRQYPVSEE